MGEFDFAEFMEAAEATGLELTPWQRDFLQQTYDGEPVRLVNLNVSRMVARRHVRDMWAAAAIASGEPVQFVATSPEQEEAARQRVLTLLDRVDRVSEDNNQ